MFILNFWLGVFFKFRSPATAALGQGGRRPGLSRSPDMGAGAPAADGVAGSP